MGVKFRTFPDFWAPTVAPTHHETPSTHVPNERSCHKLSYSHRVGVGPTPHTNGIWVGAMGIIGKIAVTAASGMSGLSALVQYPVNQRRTCDFWRFSTVFRALKVFSGLHFDLFPAMVHWLLEECQQTRHTRQSCDRDLSSDPPSTISYTAWGV